jgi:HSP20 family protein
MAQAWNPLQDLMMLQDRMNRLFEDATQRRVRGEVSPSDEIERADWYPPADVSETDGEFIVALDLPGIDRSALEISLDGGRLTIRGQRSITTPQQHRAERPRGIFLRTFGVPPGLDQAQVHADYKDGVLLVHLPKRPEERTQRVEIKIS